MFRSTRFEEHHTSFKPLKMTESFVIKASGAANFKWERIRYLISCRLLFYNAYSLPNISDTPSQQLHSVQSLEVGFHTNVCPRNGRFVHPLVRYTSQCRSTNFDTTQCGRYVQYFIIDVASSRFESANSHKTVQQAKRKQSMEAQINNGARLAFK